MPLSHWLIFCCRSSLTNQKPELSFGGDLGVIDKESYIFCASIILVEYLNLIQEDLVEYIIGLILKIKLDPTLEFVTEQKYKSFFH